MVGAIGFESALQRKRNNLQRQQTPYLPSFRSNAARMARKRHGVRRVRSLCSTINFRFTRHSPSDGYPCGPPNHLPGEPLTWYGISHRKHL